MNKVFLKGNLVKDPEVRDVSSSEKSIKVANFTVATSRYFKKADGTKASDTTFIDCEAWATGAESIEKLLKKGDPVLLEGSLKIENWEKDGKKFSRTKVRVITFEKLNRRAVEAGESTIPFSDEPEVSEDLVTVGAGGSEDTPF